VGASPSPLAPSRYTPPVPPLWFYVALAGALGLITGSYLNVVAHRLPRGVSTIAPRSRCPWCRAPIAARDNIPVLSWLMLHGRCRACGAPISPRYPIVEALTGGLFALCVVRFGITLEAVASMLFCGLLLALALIDLEFFLLPDRLTIPGILLGLALQPWLPATSFLDSMLGAISGAGVLILLINVWYWLRGNEGMGLGDVNMLAMIGAFLGWRHMLLTLVLAAVVGAITGIALLIMRRAEWQSQLPFGVFLAIAAGIALFAGDLLLAFYSALT
jgi:leader peptidase (prepilin peptidase)/N-methyltransferase